MRAKNRSGWMRRLALVIGLTVAVAACSGEDEAGATAEPTAVDEVCAAGVDDDGSSGFAAAMARVCTLDIADDDKARLFVQPCTNESLTPRFLLQNGEQLQLVSFLHMMVRFHPVDEFEQGDTEGHRAAGSLGQGELPDGANLWVIDTGFHGEFAAQTALGLLSNVDSFESVTWPAQPSLADPLVAWSVPDPVELQNGGGAVLTTVDDVISMLGAVEKADVDKNQLVLNMSLGVYNCDEEPEDLKRAIEAVTAQGVQIVASAGNDESGERVWPAAWGTDSSLGGNVTSVGSVEPDKDQRSCFSNFGDHVEVWVTGEEVLVEEVGTWSGTSFAAPQVSAMVAADRDPAGELGTQAPNDPPDMFSFTLELDDGSAVTRQTFCAEGSEYGPLGVIYE